MDGSQTLFAANEDSAEAARQAQVYARAMESIKRERLVKERRGYAVFNSVAATQSLADSAFMKGVRMFLISFAFIMPIVAMVTIAL